MVGNMGQTQSIIVYRNPLEQQMWESGTLPLFLFAGVLFVLFTYGFIQIAAWFSSEWYVSTHSWVTWVAVALAALMTANVFYILPFLL